MPRYNQDKDYLSAENTDVLLEEESIFPTTRVQFNQEGGVCLGKLQQTEMSAVYAQPFLYSWGKFAYTNRNIFP